MLIGQVPKNTQLLSRQVLFLLPSTRVTPHPKNANHPLNIRRGSIVTEYVICFFSLRSSIAANNTFRCVVFRPSIIDGTEPNKSLITNRENSLYKNNDI